LIEKIRLYWKPLFAVIAWGISFIATKIALQELHPFTIIILRLILSIALLSAIAVITKKNFSFSLRKNYSIIILALIAVFHLWIQVTGLQYTSASNTGWIIGITPVFMAVLGIIFFGERLMIINISGIIIATAGLLLLISKGNISNIGLLSNKGDFMVLASSFTWSVYSIVNKKITLSYPPLMTTLYLFTIMAIILIPFNLSSQVINSVIHLNGSIIISVLFLGIVCSGISYVLWAQTLSEMDSSRVGAFLYIEPFVTVFAASIILKENITFLIIMSGLIITAGVVLVNYKMKSFPRNSSSRR